MPVCYKDKHKAVSYFEVVLLPEKSVLLEYLQKNSISLKSKYSTTFKELFMTNLHTYVNGQANINQIKIQGTNFKFVSQT